MLRPRHRTTHCCQYSRVVRMHAAPHRRAHRRLLPPPKGLPMRSLRSRPSPSRASHRSQPRTAVGLECLPCGAARSGNASVSPTTLVRRTHGRTRRPREASSLLCARSQSPPSPTGASEHDLNADTLCAGTREPRQSDCLPRPQAGGGPEPAQPYGPTSRSLHSTDLAHCLLILSQRACLLGELLRSLPAQPERVRRPHPCTSSARAVPAVVRHASIGAGEDESGYGCAVTTPRRQTERSVPAETSGG